MTPATAWTELTIADTGWTQGFADPTYDSTTDYFIDFLFEGTGFFAPIATSYTELSVAATAFTELTTPSTSYTELTL